MIEILFWKSFHLPATSVAIFKYLEPIHIENEADAEATRPLMNGDLNVGEAGATRGVMDDLEG